MSNIVVSLSDGPENSPGLLVEHFATLFDDETRFHVRNEFVKKEFNEENIRGRDRIQTIEEVLRSKSKANRFGQPITTPLTSISTVKRDTNVNRRCTDQ